ncbi:MAG TPA: homogentisate 1,2-dioxygenase [Myxococcota bacterium]|nr:homogentisate 1,2-dioxygenase [Myxococcota bacterium]
MKNSWIHLAKGVTPKQAHVAVPKGLKEEELGRGGFHGRVANLYRLNEPTGWVRVEGDFAPGDVDGERVDTTDRTNPRGAPTRLFWNDDLTVSVSRRSEAMPWFARNADADELYFVHRGEGTFETEFGPLEFRPGDYVVLPKGVTHRVVPVSRDNYFLRLESRGEIGLIEHPNLGRHNPYDPEVIAVPEPKAMQGDGRPEYEVRVKRDGRVTAFFFDQHPIDVVGWKGDLFPFRFHNTDFRPVTADRNHVPPSAFGLVCAEGWVLCNFVPSPMQRDREAARLPYYHRNVDFDEIGFLHGGSIAGQPMEGTTIMWHPRGAVHGPGEAARAMAEQFWSEIGTNDIQAVNVDCVRPLSVAPEAMAAKRDHVQLTVRKDAT